MEEKKVYDEYKNDIAMKAKDIYREISLEDYDIEDRNKIEASYANFTLLLDDTESSFSSKEKLEKDFNVLRDLISNTLTISEKELLKKEFKKELTSSKKKLNKSFDDYIIGYPNLKSKFDELRDEYLIKIDNVSFERTFKTKFDDLSNQSIQSLKELAKEKGKGNIRKIIFILAPLILVLAIITITTVTCINNENNAARYLYNTRYTNSTDETYGYEFIGIGNNFGYNKKKNNEILEIIIPETYKGKKVISISSKAFSSTPNVQKITIPDSVTSIGKNAFDGCSALTSITIPNSVTSIEEYTFDGCSSLASITIPNSVTSIGDKAFRGCSSLTSITIPDSVTSIENNAFYGCSSLASITIPNSVTSIGDEAFNGCSSLTSITIPSSVKDLGYEPFWRCWELKVNYVFIDGTATIYNNSSLDDLMEKIASISIPNSVTSIEKNSLWGFPFLTSITIPSSVTSIGTRLLNYCSSLTSIIVEDGNEKFDSRDDCNAIIESNSNKLIAGCNNTIIPDSVTSIGDYAFNGCSSLTSITIPDSVTSIGNYAFDDCSSLTSITIPSSVTSIGDFVFNGCSSLTSIIVEDSNEEFDSRDNCNAIIESNSNKLIAGCKNTIIPNSVTSIGDYAFSGCSALTSITIPNSVTSIGDYAFGGCSALTSITIPNSVTSIEDYAFGGCSSLTSITISNSVTSIGNHAFSSSPDLKVNYVIIDGITAIEGSISTELRYKIVSVSIPDSVKSIGKDAFYSCSSLTSITIPNSVTFIGEDAFANCFSLGSIIVEDGNTKFDSRNNCNAIIESNSNKLIAGCKNTIIPNSVTSIGYSAFGGCSALTSITIPDSVTSIGSYAFSACLALTSITIPNSVTSIRENTFRNCSALTSITIPNSVTSIEYDAFYGCSSLASITIPNSVTSIGSYAFNNCPSLTIYCVATEKPSDWDTDWSGDCTVVWGYQG